MAKSGHDAGYTYAKQKGLTTQSQVDAYEGNSESFRAGLQQWVNEVIAKTKPTPNNSDQ